MSSVAPTDSVSSAGRKPRPGKRERQAARSAVGSTGGVSASKEKAAAFAAGGFDDPVPQPGKFPVVFATGVGEPTRDQEFAYSPTALKEVFSDLSPRYSENAQYAEFRSYSDSTDEDFRDWLTVSSFLRLAQQTVHAHVNMGLPQGDFASVASSEVMLPSALSAVVQQFGEMPIPSLGTRFLLRDYQNAVRRLVWVADQVDTNGDAASAIESSWFPFSRNDGVTKLVVARALCEWFRNTHGVCLTVNRVEAAVLSGHAPVEWGNMKDFLGPSPRPTGATGADPRDRFDFLFASHGTVDAVRNAYTTPGASAALLELDLTLVTTVIGRITWNFNAKESFARLAEKWARVSPTFARFFEMSSGLANRSSARGALTQFAQVSRSDGVSVLKTTMAVSAPELSLAVCFPPTCLVSGEPDRRVIVTTSLNVSQRATEFCLKDWR
ncbi:capsid protein [Talaromyces marneffei partitivirus-1]|nr:capsid protein [Talaromyces marneffei partitivirus-1]